MEAAATKMAGELAEYKAESKELRNQEHTIRRLEDRARSLEAQLEDKVPFPLYVLGMMKTIFGARLSGSLVSATLSLCECWCPEVLPYAMQGCKMREWCQIISRPCRGGSCLLCGLV